ncbi:MAG: ABC transporter permease [Acidimicrobiales bacterium]
MKQIAVRIIQAFGLILAVIVLNFLLVHLAPGDAVDALAGSGENSAETTERLREQYGLDEPITTQLFTYVGNVLQGDLGVSIANNNQPVTELIAERLWPTVLLSITALAFAIVVGTIVGTLAARNPDSPFSHGTTVFALIGFAMPAFWTGYLLLIVFSVELGWFPVSGMEDLRFEGGWFARQWDVAKHLFLPALALGLIYIAAYSRLARASMLEVLESDYVRTARAKGLNERSVLFKHALRNGVIPIVTVMGLQFGAILSGAILVETVFAWPGVGRLAFEAVVERDTNVLLGVLFLVSTTVIVANLLTDIVYRLIDPRIRVSGTPNG